MHRFVFLVHPLDLKRDVARKYPFVKFLPAPLVEAMLWRMKPKLLGKVEGVKSTSGAETEGWLIAVPMTAKMMIEREEKAVSAIVEACKLAKELGAEIVGLGAFTAIVGNGGVEIQERSPVPVTTGNSYTTWTALEATKLAAELMGIDWQNATAAVVGATGSIGKACAYFLSHGAKVGDEVRFESVSEVILVGRNEERLNSLREELNAKASASIRVTTDIAQGLNRADIVITVTSAMDAVIEPEHLKPGCIVCDVARPRDVSERVHKERDDVLVIDGGVVEVPGEPRWEFSIGLPDKLTLACVAETMLLALEGRLEPFTLGRDIRPERILEIASIAAKHGFKLAGLRSFERQVSEEQIRRVRERVGKVAIGK
ncbi:MAG: shikimate dehydrogenase [Armatimonadetes bacterium]|nr:shikimate dehydrogenase [Armatimonadota bacterium]MCX7969267.1 shikimate dehydrogenase [Armatimonadota bacterium]MDW8142806.1 shikimate dehydrogenase [Armatimonadota bacterium]